MKNDLQLEVNDLSFSMNTAWIKSIHNVFDHYLAHHHYLVSFQTLFFIFSPRRHQRRRQQYEIFQKIICDTSFNIAKIYLFTISIQNNQKIQLIDTQHSIFTF
jgi:hypothetical protein